MNSVPHPLKRTEANKNLLNEVTWTKSSDNSKPIFKRIVVISLNHTQQQLYDKHTQYNFSAFATRGESTRVRVCLCVRVIVTNDAGRQRANVSVFGFAECRLAIITMITHSQILVEGFAYSRDIVRERSLFFIPLHVWLWPERRTDIICLFSLSISLSFFG